MDPCWDTLFLPGAVFPGMREQIATANFPLESEDPQLIFCTTAFH